MKTDKEKLAEAIHALNELYEVSNELLLSRVFFYSQDRLDSLYMKLGDVLQQADKILEGN